MPMAHRCCRVVSLRMAFSTTPSIQVVSWRCVVLDAFPLDCADGCRGVVSLRVAFRPDPRCSGVVALCGLGCALPLDSVDGMVPLFGLG
jgi:hypothetical protein